MIRKTIRKFPFFRDSYDIPVLQISTPWHHLFPITCFRFLILFKPCKTYGVNGNRNRKKLIGIRWCIGISTQNLWNLPALTFPCNAPRLIPSGMNSGSRPLVVIPQSGKFTGASHNLLSWYSRQRTTRRGELQTKFAIFPDPGHFEVGSFGHYACPRKPSIADNG